MDSSCESSDVVDEVGALLKLEGSSTGPSIPPPPAELSEFGPACPLVTVTASPVADGFMYSRRVEEYIVKMRSTAHTDLRKRGYYKFETVWIFKNEALAEYVFCIK
uniref:Uncharacterized protein n=1 Tax=Caenorhabditis japonica TaxID=281687 RepID=A0A8R1IAU7_CAEJA